LNNGANDSIEEEIEKQSVNDDIISEDLPDE
jgi:hypothetical protein